MLVVFYAYTEESKHSNCFLKTKQTFGICTNFIKLQNVCDLYIPIVCVKWFFFFNVFIKNFLKIYRNVLHKKQMIYCIFETFMTSVYEKKITAEVWLTRQKEYFVFHISRQSLGDLCQKQLLCNVAFLHLLKPGEMPATDFILVVYLLVPPACYFTKRWTPCLIIYKIYDHRSC